MPHSTLTRRPGIVFQTVSTPVPDALPRMDVAGFVGFAPRGPVNVPVAVEDVARFADVFGGAVDLVRDPSTGRWVTSHLAGAVEAFFRGGGRRGWVVRVADRPATSQFVVPGLVDADTGVPAVARARSGGSGFDDLRVGTVLRRQTLPGATLVRDPAPFRLDWRVRPDGVAPGTTLRVTHPAPDGTVRHEVYAVVDAVTEPTADVAVDPSAVPDAQSVEVTVSTGRAYAIDVEVQPSTSGWPEATVRFVDGAAAPDAFADGSATVPEADATLESTPQGLLVRFDDVIDPLPSTGDVVHAEIPSEAPIWLRVAVARTVDDASAPSGRASVVLAQTTRQPVNVEDVLDAWAIAPGALVVERTSMDLIAWDGDASEQRLPDLDLSARGARSWTRLPTDADVFTPRPSDDPEALPRPEAGTLAADVFDPRFPLAGPEAGPADRLVIPFDPSPVPDPSRSRSRIDDGRRALERDGLTAFDNRLFVDEDLALASTQTLAAKASDKLFLEEAPTDGPRTVGLHTLWPIDEVALVAVPDAVHRGWMPTTVEPVSSGVVEPPATLTASPCANDPSLLCIDWTPTPAALASPPADVQYELQESPAADFDPSVRRYRGEAVHTERPITDACPQRLFFRVRAIVDGRRSPWSVTASVVVPGSDFRPKREAIDAPVLRRSPASPPADVVLRWDRIPQDGGDVPGSPPVPSVTYDLQRAQDAAFDTAEPVDDVQTIGSDELEHVPVIGETPVYFRVRARRTSSGRTSPWSNTVAIDPDVTPPLAPARIAEYDDEPDAVPNGGRNGLLDLQRAMLRFCAARGDAMAVLALPAHDRLDAARDHVARLRRFGGVPSAASGGPFDDRLLIPPLRVDESRTLSFGALYHPWATVARPAGPGGAGAGRTVTHPPDGAACGMVARRTLERGAWIAPANVPLPGALALRPSLGPSVTDALLGTAVNALALGPRGVVPQTAQTLAVDDALRPIGTRRLLILLRRLADRVGPQLVFESNGPALRRRAASVFERVLLDLFQRGALAGRTAREAYRVVCDASNNPPETVDRGLLVVDVQVAPARPLQFITVRLVQRGAQTLVREG